MSTQLTLRVLRAQQEQKVGKELRDQLSCIAYAYVQRKMGTSKGEEVAADFLLALLPDFDRAVLHYSYRGIPFEHYFNRMIAGRLMGFLRQRQQHERNRLAGEILNIEDVDGQEDRASTSGTIDWWLFAQLLANKTPKGRQACRRALLLLALKNAYFLSRRQQRQVCRLVDFPQHDFSLLAGKIVDQLKSRLVQQQGYISRLNRHRVYLLQVQQDRSRYGASEEPRRTRQLQEEYHRRVISSYQTKLSKNFLRPSHRQLAELLGMSKGTVDSLLFRLHRDLVKLWPKERAPNDEADSC